MVRCCCSFCCRRRGASVAPYAIAAAALPPPPPLLVTKKKSMFAFKVVAIATWTNKSKAAKFWRQNRVCVIKENDENDAHWNWMPTYLFNLLSMYIFVLFSFVNWIIYIISLFLRLCKARHELFSQKAVCIRISKLIFDEAIFPLISIF